MALKLCSPVSNPASILWDSPARKFPPNRSSNWFPPPSLAQAISGNSSKFVYVFFNAFPYWVLDIVIPTAMVVNFYAFIWHYIYLLLVLDHSSRVQLMVHFWDFCLS